METLLFETLLKLNNEIALLHTFLNLNTSTIINKYDAIDFKFIQENKKSVINETGNTIFMENAKIDNVIEEINKLNDLISEYKEKLSKIESENNTLKQTLIDSLKI